MGGKSINEAAGNRSLICKCERCGKDMYVPLAGSYVYKKYGRDPEPRPLYFCGWNCMRAWEKENERKTGRRRDIYDWW